MSTAYNAFFAWGTVVQAGSWWAFGTLNFSVLLWLQGKESPPVVHITCTVTDSQFQNSLYQAQPRTRGAGGGGDSTPRRSLIPLGAPHPVSRNAESVSSPQFCPSYQCEWKNVAAISVHKGCCSHQAVTLQPPGRWALRELRMETGCLPSSSQPLKPTPNSVPWGDSGWESTGHWPQMAEVQIKGMISVSPDSCTFPCIEKC